MIVMGGICALTGVAGKVTSETVSGVQARVYGIALLAFGLYLVHQLKKDRDSKRK